MKFSITIPSYKTRFFIEAVLSVVNQSYQDWELIVVDDCSPEDFKSLLNQYVHDERVRYYRNDTNCGIVNVVDNWNICLSYCTGDYVICMGDDDRLLPNCLEEYSMLIHKYPGMNVYHARTQIINEHGDVIQYLEKRAEIETAATMVYNQLKNDRKQYIGDFLFSVNWLRRNKGYVKFPLAYSSDWATANLAALENGIVNSNTFLFEYRDNELSISRTQNLKIAVDAAYLSYIWYKDFFLPKLPPTDMYTKLVLSIFREKYLKSVTDIIYLNIKYSKNKRFDSFVYWMVRYNKFEIPLLRMIDTCLRGLRASLTNNEVLQ